MKKTAKKLNKKKDNPYADMPDWNKDEKEAELIEARKTYYEVWVRGFENELSMHKIHATEHSIAESDNELTLYRKTKDREDVVAVFREWSFFERILPTA